MIWLFYSFLCFFSVFVFSFNHFVPWANRNPSQICCPLGCWTRIIRGSEIFVDKGVNVASLGSVDFWRHLQIVPFFNTVLCLFSKKCWLDRKWQSVNSWTSVKGKHNPQPEVLSKIQKNPRTRATCFFSQPILPSFLLSFSYHLPFPRWHGFWWRAQHWRLLGWARSLLSLSARQILTFSLFLFFRPCSAARKGLHTSGRRLVPHQHGWSFFFFAQRTKSAGAFHLTLFFSFSFSL